MKTVALCVNIPELDDNLAAQAVCDKYPGAGWIPEFCDLLEEQEIYVVSGSRCKDRRAYLIVEDVNRTGLGLLSDGAKGGISICAESKLYQPYYYDHIHDFRSNFKHVITFDGGTEHLKFPSYHEVVQAKEWDSRKFLCLVMANKFVANIDPASPAHQDAMKHSLQTNRYLAIDYFGDRLNLYGKGWNNPLPPQFAYMENLIKRQAPPEIVNKLDVIADYKFSICLENTIEPGYITEKIVDCFAAGVIPVYIGAPDVDLYISPKAFIDGRKFETLKKLDQHISKIDRNEAYEMLNAGKEYLSGRGKLHKYANFAEYMALKCIKDLA